MSDTGYYLTKIMNERMRHEIFSPEQKQQDEAMKARIEEIPGVETVQIIGGGDLVVKISEKENITLRKGGDKWSVHGEDELIDDGMIEEYITRKIAE